MSDDTPSVTAPIQMNIKIDLLSNALVGAFEGGSTYWMHECDYLTPKQGYAAPAYSDPKFWHEGGRMKVFYDDPNDESKRAEFEIGLPEMIVGLTKMSEHSPGHFGDLIAENDDAITHDCFVQYVIFGDVIYG